MNAFQRTRVQVLRQALDDEVHGLWISDEMAINVLARLDAATHAETADVSDQGDFGKPFAHLISNQ